LLGGSYADDAEFRARIQSWVGELWSRKDALIDEIVGAAQDHEPEEAAA
jgi:hypothetical protein